MNIPKLKVISLGAGLQSSTLVEMLAEGDLEADLVVFADTGVEPPWVYEQVEYLKTRCPVPLDVIKRGELSLIEELQQEGSFMSLPLYTRNKNGKTGILVRGCSKDFKIVPIMDYLIDKLLEKGLARVNYRGLRRVKPGVTVEVILGITYDEIQRVNRGKAPSWYVKSYPLVDLKWTRDDCTRYLEERNLPVPKRSSCYICPFHSNSYWKELRSDHPDLWKSACEFDEWIRTIDHLDNAYLHNSCRPLKEVEFEGDGIMDACGGYCHT